MIKIIKRKQKKNLKTKSSLKRRHFADAKKNALCEETKCQAINLKKCHSCHEVLKSVCSKSGCLHDGKKQVVITTAASACRSKESKRYDDDNVDDEENSDDYESDLYDDEEDDNVDYSMLIEEEQDEIEIMKKGLEIS